MCKGKYTNTMITSPRYTPTHSKSVIYFELGYCK